MGLGAATPAHRGAMLWLLAWHCHLPLAEAQTTTSGTEDVGVLLEAKAAADTSECTQHNDDSREDETCFTSWTADTEPCGAGDDSYYSGWLGVMCDAPGGRVVGVALPSTGPGMGGELLPLFGRLGALLVLNLNGNVALAGDVADLAGATELRDLDLSNCPLVVGVVAALATLVHLGEEYTMPGCGSSGCPGELLLRGTGVHGPVAALRALPGLGADWGSDYYDFDSCSTFEIAPGCAEHKVPLGGVSGCDDPRCAGLAFIESHKGEFCVGCGRPGDSVLTADTLADFLSQIGAQGEMCPGESRSSCGEAGPIANTADVAGIDASACCASGTSGPAKPPPSPPAQIQSCSSMAEFQAVLDPINTECCDEPTEDCSSGYPATCNVGCAAVLLPVQAACADFLHGVGLEPVKRAIDAAAAQCPVPLPPCSSYDEFTSALSTVTDECCDDPTEDCSSGYPASCNADCAKVLLPVQEACTEFLQGPGMKPILSSINTAVATCQSGH